MCLSSPVRHDGTGCAELVRRRLDERMRAAGPEIAAAHRGDAGSFHCAAPPANRDMYRPATRYPVVGAGAEPIGGLRCVSFTARSGSSLSPQFVLLVSVD